MARSGFPSFSSRSRSRSRSWSVVVVAAAAVAVLGVWTQPASAVCSTPAAICQVDPATGAPTDFECMCPRPLSIEYDPNDPFMTMTGCPSCPRIPGSCPDIVPSHPSKAKVCHQNGHGGYQMIEISQNAVNAHLRHGDFLPTVDTCCICDLDLCEQRKQTIDARWQSHLLWFDPANLVDKAATMVAYEALLFPRFTADHTFIVQGIGTFGPRQVAAEYDLITTPYISNQLLYLDYQAYNISWRNNGTVIHYNACERYRFDFTNSFQAAMSVYNGDVTFRFAPNSYLMYEADDIPACPLRAPVGPLDAGTISYFCSTLHDKCLTIPTYEFNGNVAGCEALWTHLSLKQAAINSGLCNYKYPGTADTLQCRQVHYLSAQVDPATHCPHTNTVSVPCHDTLDDYPGDSCPYYTGPPRP